MTAKKKTTRKPKTDDCQVVEEVPPTCPNQRCMSTSRTRFEGSLIRKISGVGKDGRPFNQIRWSYATCKKCGQRYRIIRREYVTHGETAGQTK